jgi:hypothetical protein
MLCFVTRFLISATKRITFLEGFLSKKIKLQNRNRVYNIYHSFLNELTAMTIRVYNKYG